jgi:hypothetical protein
MHFRESGCLGSGSQETLSIVLLLLGTNAAAAVRTCAIGMSLSPKDHSMGRHWAAFIDAVW